MKKFTFTVPNNTIKSINNSYPYGYYKESYTSDSDKLKSFLATNAVNKYPWLSSIYDTEEFYYTPKTKITYNIKIKPKKSFTEFYNTLNFGTLYDFFTSYSKKYRSSDFVDEYDFKINGIPVRIYDDRIQIGYNFVTNDFKLNSNLKPIIYKIYINYFNV